MTELEKAHRLIGDMIQAQHQMERRLVEMEAALVCIRDDAANAADYIEETDIEARLGTIIYYADKALGHVRPAL